jgi:Penicillin-Binding Protein C-terminus Family
MLSRSASTRLIRSRSGSAGQTIARCSASPDAKPPRRYCSTLSQGSAPGTNSLPRPPVFSRAGPASLPPPLRHLRKDVPTILAAVATAQLKIAFPPDGARVDLGLTLPPPQGPQPRARLALKAEGGVLPLRWIVNGTPVEGPDLRRQAAWTPDGAGFAPCRSWMQEGRRTACLCGWSRESQCFYSGGQLRARFRLKKRVILLQSQTNGSNSKIPNFFSPISSAPAPQP